MAGVADGVVGTGLESVGVGLATLPLAHRTVAASKTAIAAHQRLSVTAAMRRIPSVAVWSLCTIRRAKFFRLLGFAPRLFSGGNFERKAPGLVDKQAEDNCARESQ